MGVEEGFLHLGAVTMKKDRAAGSGSSWDAGGSLPTGFGPMEQSYMTAM